jgi:PAS domain S-box-containing protein
VSDWDKSKAQLIEELAALRTEVAMLRQNSGSSFHKQSVSEVQGAPLLVASGNGASTSAPDSSSASFNLTETSVLVVLPKAALHHPLDPCQSAEVGFQLTPDNDCLQPEQLLNSFFSAAAHSNLGLFILDSQLRFLRLNQALAEMNGYSVKVHLGQPLHALLPDLAPTLTPILKGIFETGEPVSNLEISGYTPSQPGTLRHWLAALFPITNAAGQVVAIGGSVREVTEFRQLLGRLQEHEFNWKTAQRIAHVGCWQFDYVTDTVTWSEEVYRIHGCDPALPPPQGETSEADLRIIRPNGEVRYIEARCSPRAFNDQGEVVEVFGTVLDVTERKQVEAALRRSEANLARAQKIAKLGHWEYDLASQTCTWSDELYAIHQLDPAQPPPNGDAMDHLIHPDDLWIDRQQLKAPLLAGKPCQADLRIIRQDGEIRHVEARGEPIFDDKGNVTHWVGTLFDISDRKRIEEKLRRSEAEMAAILKAIPDMLIRMTKDDRRLSIMPGTLTPCQPIAQLQKQLVYETLPFHLAKQRMEHIHKAIETRELQVYEYDILINGVLRKEEARLIAINDSEALIIVRDITERHQVEQVKDEFISMVSHELRTPLTSIQVALSLLDEQLVNPSSDDGQQMIHVATEGVDRLVRLVNDILDLERLESGKLRIQKQPCQTQALIDTATQEMQDLANRANVTIATSGISQDLQADRDRIVQVLTNLLSNAIRFSNPGDQVWVDVQEWNGKVGAADVERVGWREGEMARSHDSSTTELTTPPSHHHPTILFTVKDQGRGIPPEKLECIFERFQQADASDSRERSGTGLGLTICQKIIQQHGGHIWVESTLGQGSTFYFTVPIGDGGDHGSKTNPRD